MEGARRRRYDSAQVRLAKSKDDVMPMDARGLAWAARYANLMIGRVVASSLKCQNF